MSEEKFQQIVRSEQVKDWRYWFTWIVSGFLLSSLVVDFFQVENTLVYIAVVAICSWFCLNMTNNHYENVIAHEIGYNRE